MAGGPRLRFPCPACGARRDLTLPAAAATCRACGRVDLLRGGEALRSAWKLERCVACGDARLYRQKDLDRKVGLGVVLGGAAASLALLPFSALAAYGVLFGLALIDLALYRRLPEVGICYRCRCEHRGYDPASGLPPFDLLTLELVDEQKRREAGGAAGSVGKP